MAAEDLVEVASAAEALGASAAEVVAEVAPAADGNVYKFILGKAYFVLMPVQGKYKSFFLVALL